MHVRLVLALRCLRTGRLDLRAGPRALSQSHPWRQEQGRPHRFGEDRPSAAHQPDPAGLRVSGEPAATARAMASTPVLCLATLGTAGTDSIASAGVPPAGDPAKSPGS